MRLQAFAAFGVPPRVGLSTARSRTAADTFRAREYTPHTLGMKRELRAVILSLAFIASLTSVAPSSAADAPPTGCPADWQMNWRTSARPDTGEVQVDETTGVWAAAQAAFGNNVEARWAIDYSFDGSTWMESPDLASRPASTYKVGTAFVDLWSLLLSPNLRERARVQVRKAGCADGPVIFTSPGSATVPFVLAGVGTAAVSTPEEVVEWLVAGSTEVTLSQRDQLLSVLKANLSVYHGLAAPVTAASRSIDQTSATYHTVGFNAGVSLLTTQAASQCMTLGRSGNVGHLVQFNKSPCEVLAVTVGNRLKVQPARMDNFRVFVLAKYTVRFAPAANVVTKKSTITCIKGGQSKKVTAVKPKCPTGWKLKK